MIKAVLFDLDGTIINSEEGITKCVQYALSSFGIEEPDRKKLLCFIGPPLRSETQSLYHIEYISDDDASRDCMIFRIGRKCRTDA